MGFNQNSQPFERWPITLLIKMLLRDLGLMGLWWPLQHSALLIVECLEHWGCKSYQIVNIQLELLKNLNIAEANFKKKTQNSKPDAWIFLYDHLRWSANVYIDITLDSGGVTI